MAETPLPVEIPDRALFKAAEVCALARVQPYVLRSGEAEFKDLGVARNGSAVRVYRRQDVERVLRIKHLLLVEGLTLAGVRRRLEDEAEPPLEQDAVVTAGGAAGVSADARARLGQVRDGLRSLLALLEAPGRTAAKAAARSSASDDFALTPAAAQRAGAEPAEGEQRGERPARGASPRRRRSA